jgi:engulfment/cell motility protein 1
MQNLMELETGWSNPDTIFIYKVVQILANPNNPVNVRRECHLEEAGRSRSTAYTRPHLLFWESEWTTCSPAGERVPVQFRRRVGGDEEGAGPARYCCEPACSADSMMGLYRFVLPPFLSRTLYSSGQLDSMMLINSLLSHVTEAHLDEFTLEIERLNVNKAVEPLMSWCASCTGADGSRERGGAGGAEYDLALVQGGRDFFRSVRRPDG